MRRHVVNTYCDYLIGFPEKRFISIIVIVSRHMRNGKFTFIFFEIKVQTFTITLYLLGNAEQYLLIIILLISACQLKTMSAFPPSAFSAGRIRETQRDRDMKLAKNMNKPNESSKFFETTCEYSIFL